MRLNLARRRGAMALIATLLVAPINAATVSAAEPPLPGECPAFVTSTPATGATGNGWTVERGTTRERFRFEVLGVIDDGIAPGRDMILVELSDAEGNDMIQRAGGLWLGMSGSPVYLGPKLLGAISYRLTGGPSPIAGVTRAVDMDDVLGYGPATASIATPARITIPASLQAKIVGGAPGATVNPATLERLPVPFSVSGLNARGRAQLERELAGHQISGIVVPASRAARSAGMVISSRPAPGGNFAGVVSYGDVTVGAIGTTTYVCGDNALAFGHPLTFSGATAFGANNANALAIVGDGVQSPFKLANITGLFGKLDQDRLTAIRADLDSTPTLRPITSHVVNVDTGAVRNGRTDVTMNEWVPSVAPLHLLSNADVVFDETGQGSSLVSWTITGKRRNGNTWQLEYANRYASQGDIAYDSVSQLAGQLSIIGANPFEEPRFTSVHIDATFDDTFRQYGIESVKVSKNGGTFRERSFISVSPGDNLRARVGLRKYRGTLVNVILEINVPGDAQPGSFGSLLIRGGSEFFFGDEPESIHSFTQLINALENTPRNDDLLASLVLSSFDSEPSTTNDDHRMDAVVGGYVEISVEVN